MRGLINFILLILLNLKQSVDTLDVFNPYQHSGSCTASMSICTFELHATAAMTMFYKNLFRVVADNNGMLQNYQNSNQTFSMQDIITADGYPKLVRHFCFLPCLKHVLDLYYLGICVQQLSSGSRTPCLSKSNSANTNL